MHACTDLYNIQKRHITRCTCTYLYLHPDLRINTNARLHITLNKLNSNKTLILSILLTEEIP